MRAAIQEANHTFGSVIALQGGATYTLTIKGAGEDNGATGDLDIKAPMTISAAPAPAIVRGGSSWNDRIFDVFEDNVRISSVMIQGGTSSSGGGLRNGLHLHPLTLDRCTVSGNTGGSGGGIDNSGYLALSSSTVAGNRAESGGGIFNHGTGVTFLADSTVSGNTADVKGGSTSADGGGVANEGSLQVYNCTISGNRASGNGGGIWNAGTVGGTNATIATNVADSDANGSGDGGGIFIVQTGVTNLANSIIAANSDLSSNSKAPDCAGSLAVPTYTLIQNSTGCSISSGGGVITDRDAKLGPLQDNGGLTLTHALLQGLLPRLSSPAIDAGNSSTLGTQCATTDQRGSTRPQDGNNDGSLRCDMGAYEAPTPSLTQGTFTFDLTEATAVVGDHARYEFVWTVPGPGWRVLDTLQVRIADSERTILWIRFHEVPGSAGTFSLVDPSDGSVGPEFAPGSPNRLETDSAVLYLAGTAVDGPPGSRVGLTLDLGFKPLAAGDSGREYRIEVLATDDHGNTQGFTQAGLVTVQ